LAHFGDTALRLLPVAHELNIPLVAHFHGYDLSSSLRNRWYRWSLKASLSRFTSAIVVGTRQHDVLQGYGLPANNIHIIPCGVPTDTFVPRHISRRTNRINFICVSRLVECKGVRESIAAFGIVCHHLHNVHLTVVGDGPERASLELLVKNLRLSSQICFRGALSSDQVRLLLRDSDVFLQHSLVGQDGSIEGFGVSVAEAAASGIPVVATRCGGILDQVVHGETGLLVEPRDIEGMSLAMLRLAVDRELRARLGLAARQRAVALYDTATQVAKLEQVLLAAIADRGDSRSQ
jgi:glycosyltransferase involved in cell wall biosynthesis